MFGSSKDNKKQQLKAEHERQLKKALAEKCADMGGQYASHNEDETEYTVMTINGKKIRVKKEEITIASLTDLKLGKRKK